MLQFARCGGLKKVEQSLKQCIAQLTEQVHEQYPDISIQVSDSIKEGKKLLANTDALYSAIRNLVDNAIQATEKVEQAKVLLSIRSTGAHISFSVEDNGCGIEDTIDGKIFEPFFTTKQGGSGLGLAVVHGVVKAHNGNVSVQSKPGHTVITITIPLMK
jgi:signal transduction histidine kinase